MIELWVAVEVYKLRCVSFLPIYGHTGGMYLEVKEMWDAMNEWMNEWINLFNVEGKNNYKSVYKMKRLQNLKMELR